MKKLIFIIILLSSMCYSASFKLGVSANYQYITDFDESYFNGGALSLGFGYNFEINENLSFTFETLFDLGIIGGGFSGNDSKHLQLAIVELPFYINLKLKHNSNLYVGGYLYQHILGASPMDDDSAEESIAKYEKAKYQDNPPFGGVLTGITIPVGNFFIDLRYKLDILPKYRNITLLENQIAIYFCTSY